MYKFIATVFFTILIFSNVSAQSTCKIRPSCEAMGYTKTQADCNGKDFIRCPFDKSAYYCQGSSCDGLANMDCGTFRCKETYATDGCDEFCKICYTDTCDYPENADYPLKANCEYGCDDQGTIEGCDTRCHACTSCVPNDCSGYNLNDCPDHGICNSCSTGCGTDTVKYKIKYPYCEDGYDYNSGVCRPDCDKYDNCFPYIECTYDRKPSSSWFVEAIPDNVDSYQVWLYCVNGQKYETYSLLSCRDGYVLNDDETECVEVNPVCAEGYEVDASGRGCVPEGCGQYRVDCDTGGGVTSCWSRTCNGAQVYEPTGDPMDDCDFTDTGMHWSDCEWNGEYCICRTYDSPSCEPGSSDMCPEV